MTERTKLTRRRILASIGTVGAAGAGAGIGTKALFSDEESYANNEIVAGELDLKVDWEEHYSYPQLYGFGDPAANLDVTRSKPSDTSAYLGLPYPGDPVAWVHEDDLDQYMSNTAIDAYPDTNDDGSQDFPDGWDICEEDADLPGVLGDDLRTNGEKFPHDLGDPLIELEDVKPGDFGEVTFSFHLCDNPGYVWLTGKLRGAAENGLTEPEQDAPDEDGDADSTVPADVELLNAVKAAFWYDTGEDGEYGTDSEGEGDNYPQAAEGVIHIGTLGSVLLQLEQNPFPLDADPGEDGGGSSGGGSGGSSGGGSGTAPEVDDLSKTTQYTSTEDEPFKSYVTKPSGKASPENLDCADYETVLGIDLIGTAIEAGKLEEKEYTDSCADFTVESFGNGQITLSTGNPVRVVSVKGGNEGEEIYVFDEPVKLDGVTFSTPTDQDISNIDVCCPVDGDDGDDPFPDPDPDGDRQCFENSTDAYVGFAWWLPSETGNEIQGDSVSFDLGFYTEQCRNNSTPTGPNRTFE